MQTSKRDFQLYVRHGPTQHPSKDQRRTLPSSEPAVEYGCVSVRTAAGAGGFVAVEEDAEAVEGEHVVDLGVRAVGLRTSG
jgi:hypothetical protein